MNVLILFWIGCNMSPQIAQASICSPAMFKDKPPEIVWSHDSSNIYYYGKTGSVLLKKNTADGSVSKAIDDSYKLSISSLRSVAGGRFIAIHGYDIYNHGGIYALPISNTSQMPIPISDSSYYYCHWLGNSNYLIQYKLNWDGHELSRINFFLIELVDNGIKHHDSLKYETSSGQQFVSPVFQESESAYLVFHHQNEKKWDVIDSVYKAGRSNNKIYFRKILEYGKALSPPNVKPSPDQETIAMGSEIYKYSQSKSMFTKVLDLRDLVNSENNESIDMVQCFSNSKRLIFRVYGTGKWYAANLDGSDLKLLLDKKDSVHNYLKLFPKNDKIIIKSEKIKNTSEGSISIMDPDGSNKKEVLGFTPELTDTIVLSPDGTKIAYFVSRNIKNSRPEYTLKVLDIESGKHLD